MTRQTKKYLFDIKLSCEKILDNYLNGVTDHSALEENELLQDGIERQFIIIGEAVSRLRKMDVQLEDSDRLINRRNTLVHQYDVIKSKTLWTFCKFELPDLLDEVIGLLDE